LSDQSDLERTHSATPRRLEQALEQGQVVRSLELTTFLMLLAGTAGIWALGHPLLDSLSRVLQHGLELDRRAIAEPDIMMQRLVELGTDALVAFLPLFGLLFVTALAAPSLLTGRVHASAIRFDPSRMNPLTGITRIFSMHGVMELIKAVVKAGIVGGIGAWVLMRHLDDLLLLVNATPDEGIRSLGALVVASAFSVVCGLFVIAAIDVPFQLWTYYKGLRMTRDEVRQEARETEGDPQVKSHIRRAQREAARRRMMAEVPKADVIVTNPTHYAVALRYDGAKMRAPRLVAKGADLVAQRIREIGEEHRVPVLEAPPLARALYHHTELGEEIPEGLYTTVAEVLAYVFQLRRHESAGGPAPALPGALAVPPELDPLAVKQ
jgi:flagellar biosynthesis protein FlhB